MKNFRRIFIMVFAAILVIFAFTNTYLLSDKGTDGRPYRVEINRIAEEIRQDGSEHIDLSEYEYITNITKETGGEGFFDDAQSDYSIRKIDGVIYRFDFSFRSERLNKNLVVYVNSILVMMSAVVIGSLLFVRKKILRPFERIRDVPYELSKGNLTVPMQENKSRFFGRFVWGVDLLRENMEQQKRRELELQKNQKTILLSISHDIKTPLSAIKLYSKALSIGLYADKDRQIEISESINAKADEIEGFVSQMIQASNGEFLHLEVNRGEFYLSELVHNIVNYYSEKLLLVQTDFFVGSYSDCILSGDLNRSVEVLQNIMENAIKYGNGHLIRMDFSEEEDCRLIAVSNSGCTLPENEMPHIFDSFWRGSNADGKSGSGLGLHICRQLLNRMDGDVFAGCENGVICFTVVLKKV